HPRRRSLRTPMPRAAPLQRRYGGRARTDSRRAPSMHALRRVRRTTPCRAQSRSGRRSETQFRLLRRQAHQQTANTRRAELHAPRATATIALRPRPMRPRRQSQRREGSPAGSGRTAPSRPESIRRRTDPSQANGIGRKNARRGTPSPVPFRRLCCANASMVRSNESGVRAFFRNTPRWRKMRHSIVAAAALTVALATSTANAQNTTDATATPKGIVGGVLLGGEVVMGVEAALKV